jgi:hypothetical protein
MYAAVRTYTGAGAKDFFDLLEKRKERSRSRHAFCAGAGEPVPQICTGR